MEAGIVFKTFALIGEIRQERKGEHGKAVNDC